MKSERFFLPTPTPPRSLCWQGEGLTDWTAGGTHYALDGTVRDSHVAFRYRFDSAVSTPDGRYAVLYEGLGTKGLLLREGRVLRELNRSYYHADVYDYPVALVTLPSGRTLLAHCPDEYCRLELEDAETGERLTRRQSDSPDLFHSRLQFSPEGRYLVSAGWVWHPLDVVQVFDVARALEAPETLDDAYPGPFALGELGTELCTATFGAPGQLVFTGYDVEDAAFPQKAEPGAGSLCVYALSERRFLSIAPMEEAVGTMMAVGDCVVGFNEYPKLFELATGRVVARWPELSTGLRTSSIRHHLPAPPPLALDPERRRFAVGTEKGIEVVQLVP
jgi:hypothetical protein